MENKKLILIDKNDEQLELLTLIDSIIRKINDKDVIEKSQGRNVVGGFMEALIDKQDPFVTALATLGGEQSLHAIGILLFVSFQLGYSFGSGSFTLKPEP